LSGLTPSRQRFKKNLHINEGMKKCFILEPEIQVMGKLLILARYIFLVYGVDIHEKRRHVHITHAQRGYKVSCKFWLEP